MNDPVWWYPDDSGDGVMVMGDDGAGEPVEWVATDTVSAAEWPWSAP